MSIHKRAAPHTDDGPRSAVEHEPAQFVAQALVVERQLPDLGGQLIALKPALPASGGLALGIGRCRLDGPDGVGRGPKLVGGHVADRGGLARGVCGEPWSAAQVSGRSVGVAGCGARVPPAHLAARPCTPEFDRSPGPIVVRPRRLEQGQHVLGAVGGPGGEQLMVGVGQGAAAADRDEPRVADLGEDHHAGHVAAMPAKVAASTYPAGRDRRAGGKWPRWSMAWQMVLAPEQ